MENQRDSGDIVNPSLGIVENGDSIEIKSLQTNFTSEADERCKLQTNLENFYSILSSESRIVQGIHFQNVTLLDLSQCNLEQVPNCIAQLKLSSLLLRKNNLTNVPFCLYFGLDSLQTLDISFNAIQDFEIEPKCHKSLRVLKINNINLKNLPCWILAQRCSNLEYLDYSFNRVTDLKCLSDIYDIKMKKLYMKNCCLIDRDFSFLGIIKHLEELNISNEFELIEKGKISEEVVLKRNNFSDVNYLLTNQKWKNIKVLHLNKLSLAVVPEKIMHLESLKELYLVDNYLSYLPNQMSNLINLEVLDVSCNIFTFLPKDLLSLTSLRVLKAANNHIDFLYDVSPMKNLCTLDLYNNKLTDFDYCITPIEYIDLERNWFDTEQCPFYSLYEIKKQNYRTTLNEERFNGTTLESYSNLSSDFDSSTSSGSETVDNEVIFESFNVDALSENWDDPNTSVIYYERHPEVTSSDEEWQGSESLPLENQRYPSSYRDDAIRSHVNEDFMFCDVEND